MFNQITTVSNPQGRSLPRPAASLILSTCSSWSDCRLLHAYGQAHNLCKQSLVNAARRKALRRVIRWNSVSPFNESSLVVNLIPTRSR